MEFIGKSMSSLANAAGLFATTGLKFALKSVTASTQDKTKTITNYLGTPNAKLFLHLVFLQALVVFGAKRESILLMNGSESPSGREDVNGDDNHIITLPSEAASWLRRTSRFGLCWASACCSILFTANVAFDVLFCYKINRADRLEKNESIVTNIIKEGTWFAENLFR